MLVRTQQRGIDSSLYNKANELQEDISMKKFDLRAKQIHLAAVRAQVSYINIPVFYVSINYSKLFGKPIEI